MNKTETAQLLTIASGFDRRQVDAMTVEAWHAVIGEYTLAQAQRALMDHYRDPETRHTYLGVANILDRLEVIKRARSRDVEADVRSAQARGIVPEDWPRRKPLEPAAAEALARARERDRAEAITHGASEIAGA